MTDARTALRQLHNATCECGRPKSTMKSFCANDWRMLPQAMMRALYKPVGQGYERAYDEAHRYLVERRKTASEVGAGRHTKLF